MLIDGGFLTAPDFTELGMPVLSDRTELAAWMQSNELCFPDWATATRRLAEMVSADVTPALKAYVHEVMVEVDGEVREAASPEQMADLLLAVVCQDVVALARRLRVPTLLIACGRRPAVDQSGRGRGGPLSAHPPWWTCTSPTSGGTTRSCKRRKRHPA